MSPNGGGGDRESSPSTASPIEKLPVKRLRSTSNKPRDSSRSLIYLNNQNEQPRNMSNFLTQPRFLVISHANKEKNLSKVSPFLINKVINYQAGQVKQIKKLHNGTILVETLLDKQAEALLKMDNFIKDIPVIVKPHQKLNSSKGLIYCPDLIETSKEEILLELKEQNVVDLYKITRRDNGEIISTPLIVLTFSTPNLPLRIRVGYLNLEVRKYYPAPMRCFLCNKFSHTSSRCTSGTETCGFCAEPAHKGFGCGDRPARCVNCNQQHPSFYRGCPAYLKEKLIIKRSVDQNISYFAAKKQLEKSDPILSYSSATQSSNQCSSCLELKNTIKQLKEQIDFLNEKINMLIPVNMNTDSNENDKTDSNTEGMETEVEIQKETPPLSPSPSLRQPARGDNLSLKSIINSKSDGEETSSESEFKQVSYKKSKKSKKGYSGGRVKLKLKPV